MMLIKKKSRSHNLSRLQREHSLTRTSLPIGTSGKVAKPLVVMLQKTLLTLINRKNETINSDNFRFNSN